MKRLIAFALALAVVFGVSFALYKPERIEAAAQETMDDEWVGYFFVLEPFDGRRYATENGDDYDFGVPGVPVFVTITAFEPDDPDYEEGSEFNNSVGAAVSDEVETLLRVYTEGARDADAMLGRLVDTFSAVEEPVVLVFFGDHLPYLGDNQLAYAELGFTARPEWDALTSYETPYVIWANDAAAQALDWEAAVASLDLPEDGRLSASFLGAAVLELTGRTGESPWFDFLNQLRRELPVVQKQAYQLADGTVTDQLTEEQAAKIAKWRQWSYYKLMYKEID